MISAVRDAAQQIRRVHDARPDTFVRQMTGPGRGLRLALPR